MYSIALQNGQILPNKSGYPSIGERTTKWDARVRAMEHYSSTERNDLSSHAKTWMILPFMLRMTEDNLNKLHAGQSHVHDTGEERILEMANSSD